QCRYAPRHELLFVIDHERHEACQAVAANRQRGISLATECVALQLEQAIAHGGGRGASFAPASLLQRLNSGDCATMDAAAARKRSTASGGSEKEVGRSLR